MFEGLGSWDKGWVFEGLGSWLYVPGLREEAVGDGREERPSEGALLRFAHLLHPGQCSTHLRQC